MEYEEIIYGSVWILCFIYKIFLNFKLKKLNSLESCYLIWIYFVKILYVGFMLVVVWDVKVLIKIKIKK